jgi:hypothetical protein
MGSPRPLTRLAAIAAAALACAVPALAPAAATAQTTAPAASPLDGDGMWIWYVSRSGGSAAAIAAQAKTYGIETVFIKSADAASQWSQFTPELVAELHAAGLRVCGWQFVYGRDPYGEAAAGASAAADGADCMIIDAESDYEGRYRQASQYMKALRAAVGPDYPLGLSGFPYVDYHPSFPYSVFLGPNGAQFNLPQVYWHTIGTSVGAAYKHTYKFNSVYRRPIYPVGQTYADPPLSEISQFRSYGQLYGAPGVSWWSWQETSTTEWTTLATPMAASSGARPPARYPRLRPGSRGDLVVYLQQLLRGAGRKVPVTGVFSKKTTGAVRRFQKRSRIKPSGKVAASTWAKLLAFQPKPIDWSLRKASAGTARAAAAGRAPLSAGLPARAYEIPPEGGAG